MARTATPEAPAKPATVELPEARERYQVYTDWLLSEHGYEIDADAAQVAVTLYHDFQASDANKEFNAKSRAESAAQREAREARAAEREERKAEREAAKAEKAAAKAEKAAAKAAPTGDTAPVRRGRGAAAAPVEDAAPVAKPATRGRRGKTVVAEEEAAPAAPARKATARRAPARKQATSASDADLF